MTRRSIGELHTIADQAFLDRIWMLVTVQRGSPRAEIDVAVGTFEVMHGCRIVPPSEDLGRVLRLES